MPASEKQVEANRRNALKSTGPKTEEGKARSRTNALRHGCTALHVALAHEDAGEFQESREELVRTWQPADIAEMQLVELVAHAWVRLQRVARFEASLMDGLVVTGKRRHRKSTAPLPTDDLGIVVAMGNAQDEQSWRILDRYRQRASAEYHRALDSLRKAQSERRAGPLRELRLHEARWRHERRTRSVLTPVPATKMGSFGADRPAAEPDAASLVKADEKNCYGDVLMSDRL